ncbi:MAG: DUF2017 family protein [Acidimicrobiales bacterium]|jgi:hypothetical protein
MSIRRRIRPSRDGGFTVRLAPEERALLTVLPLQLLSQLDALGVDSSCEPPELLRRLMPPAYPTDPDAETAFALMTRQDLLDHHRETLETMSLTAQATWIDEHQSAAWLAALNDLRLTLGTMLGATEDGAEPPVTADHQAEWIEYLYLGCLQSELIDVLEAQLPAPVPGADELVPGDHWGDPPGGLRWDGTPQPEDG